MSRSKFHVPRANGSLLGCRFADVRGWDARAASERGLLREQRAHAAREERPRAAVRAPGGRARAQPALLEPSRHPLICFSTHSVVYTNVLDELTQKHSRLLARKFNVCTSTTSRPQFPDPIRRDRNEGIATSADISSLMQFCSPTAPPPQQLPHL